MHFWRKKRMLRVKFSEKAIIIIIIIIIYCLNLHANKTITQFLRISYHSHLYYNLFISQVFP